jgi:DNA-binding FrmR family transcriptional regulator
MAHVNHGGEKLLARVRRIKGQIAALEKSLMTGEAECSATLQQIAAVRGATNGLMAEVMESHIRDHLGAVDAPPRERAADVEVVVRALRSYLK